ncbi:MAG: GGDEF domain-containing protein [Treponema sp.]|nr:GGDEF domain-containing protein [Treponema sp.]
MLDSFWSILPPQNSRLLQNDKDLIKRNKVRVREQNRIYFRYAAELFTTAMFFATIGSLYFEELRPGLPVFASSAVIGFSLCLLAISNIRIVKKHPLPFIYIVALLCSWTATENAIFLSNGIGSSVIFTTALLVFAIIALDYSWRINLFVAILTVLFATAALLFEPPARGIRDAVGSSIITLLTILIGYVPRASLLLNFEHERILQIERNIDTLTTLPNRRKLFEELAKSEQVDCKNPFTGALMIDIDNFKQFNDTYGHQKGDLILQQIGCFFNDFSFDNHFETFRYGGEEFLALTTTFDAKQLESLAKNLVQTVYNLQIPYPAAELHYVTISIGYAYTNTDQNIKYEDLIEQADRALYKAKRTGKNQAINANAL